MVEGGFSSTRTDAFPAGLRVLVVDDDPTWLKILEKMLKKCSYEVTTCCLARDALNKLREKKDSYDIVISDVNMPDMDGFKLLEHVGLEMDLPVIMMSVDGETSRVMKGVQHGACDYLLKPIRMKELRNIWQHVLRKRLHEVRDIESFEGIESINMTRSCSDMSDDGNMLFGEDTTSARKRKDAESKHDDKDFGDHSTKKARVVWSVDLHQKFVKAVNHIGFDKVGPKKILDLMNVPWLTRENVASHLQKYRLYLSRLQKENEMKISCIANKHTDTSPKDNAGCFGLKNSANMHQTEVSVGSYGFSVSNSVIQNIEISGHESEQKGTTSVPGVDVKVPLQVEVPGPRKARSSEVCFDRSLGPIDSGINYASSLESNIPAYSWVGIPEDQFKQESKPLDLENCFNQLPLPQPAPISSGSSINESDAGSSTIEAKPSYFDSAFPIQKSQALANQVFEPISATTSNMKGLNSLTGMESVQKNMNLGVGSPFAPLDEDLRVFWLQGDYHAMNLGLQNIEFTEYNDPALFAEVPSHLFDALRFDYDHLFDPTECSVIDQGLFIA